LSRTVADRVHEIGVRMALGARPQDVLRLVLSQGGLLVLGGLLVGILAAIGGARLLSSLLYGVSATSAHFYAIVAAALMSVSFVAMALPARRASRIDPMAALRQP
jgi:putative ABC transport system permease protein